MYLFSSRCSFILVTSVLASLNLPAAIEDLSGQTIPKSVLDKSAAVNEKGGVKSIDTYMQDLPELLQRNREILDEVRISILGLVQNEASKQRRCSQLRTLCMLDDSNNYTTLACKSQS